MMLLENYLIEQFLLKVKNQHISMYMYLSDRIRRMFLSGACPQNISPKKSLSLKDQRFLQKNVADQNLSRILVKQQKLLYEKHIGLLLQEKKATNKSNLKPLLYQEKTKKNKSTYNFSKNSEGLFVQKIKVQNVIHAKALFVKDESSYKNCRYLYDHESLKTSIVPQIFKNQKPISRAKTLLHERKKIALLYGQLAKKDIINISKKALSIPGFFEDNMFTLLESRVDVCVFRAGFSKTIAGARQLIRNGSVLVNGQKIYSCKRKAKPGDFFSFTKKQTILNPYQSTNLELYHLCLSSNFLREWLFLNKKVFLWQLSFRHEYSLTGLDTKKNNNRLLSVPEWLLLLFFAVPSNKSYKPSFCSSLYWGFFLYKLKKMPVFSCFFEPKKKPNKAFKICEKYSFNGMVTAPLIAGKGEKARKSWHKGLAEKALPLDILVARKLGEGGLQEKNKTHFQAKEMIKGIVTNAPSAELNKAWTLQSKPYLRCYASIAWLSGMAQCFILRKKEKKNKKLSIKQLAFIKKKSVVLLNLYTQLLLKKQQEITKKKPRSHFAPCRGFSGNLSGVRSIVMPLQQALQSNSLATNGHAKQDQARHEQHLFFRKKVPSSNLWAIWGQKPLHLEISHKTGAFIYMYKPQKMISPVCLNFKP